MGKDKEVSARINEKLVLVKKVDWMSEKSLEEKFKEWFVLDTHKWGKDCVGSERRLSSDSFKAGYSLAQKEIIEELEDRIKRCLIHCDKFGDEYGYHKQNVDLYGSVIKLIKDRK